LAITPNISLQTHQLSKRYNRDWIFRNLSTSFETGKTYAITGPNGSGKSTLLQVLWGQLPPTEGKLEYTVEGVSIPVEEIYKEVSIATPYLDLIEEFTLLEMVDFHFKMRKLRTGLSAESIPELLELSHATHKTIGFFSSGMKQRLKLGLALFTASNFVFLDEPFTNLDVNAIAWYKRHLKHLEQSIVFIASNDPKEYEGANSIIQVNEIR
jgi:ABC-type multidrug transport system ATPase subunit